MNILKHMEAVFAVALTVAVSAGYFAGAAEPQLAADVATPTKMAVVNVTAKRLTAAQKLQMTLAERAAAANRA
ncbi:MAG: hypothetical protein ACJ8LG_18615 [Massilia sp.]